MENRCFIIIPSTEPNGYSQGHFSRVYDYIIVPACRAAGFWPTRADSTSYSHPIDAVKDLVDSEIVLCDVSTNYAHALYALAVRNALDLPVTLVKDLKTFVLFDAASFDAVDYDESLRIDTVQKEVEVLSAALKKAVESKKERHPLLSRLSIGVPQSTMPPILTTDAEEPAHEETKPKEHLLPKISPLPEYVGDPLTEDEIEKLKPGDFLFHLNHGKGKVNFIKNTGKDKLTSIQFDSGPKLLVVAPSDYFRKVN